MNMKEELMKELKESMQQKDTLRKDTITMLRAAILKVEKDTQKELALEEMQAIVAKEIKNRKESITEFEKGSREDLIEKTNKEIEILTKYLPEQLTNDEILALIKNAIASTSASSIKDMGKVMGAIKTAVSGKADGKVVSDLVRAELSKL